MKHHDVAVWSSSEDMPPARQLAWTFAEFAAQARDTEPDTANAVVDRVIDCHAVALAALGNPSPQIAFAQALSHPRKRGATLIGTANRVDCAWAAWANGTAVRELDFHDNYYGENVCHPADAIAPILAVAQHQGCSGKALCHGVAVAYEVEIALAKAINLTDHGIDQIAHIAPGVAAGLGAMLGLPTAVLFEAINHAVFVSVSTVLARRGYITGWKANAPGHIGKLAIEAIDRAMRGEQSPRPVYEDRFGLIARFLGGPSAHYNVSLPETGEPLRAIFDSFAKEHATGYHAQAAIDLAFRMRKQVNDIEEIESVEIRTKAYTHNYVGTGANDPEKMNPEASHANLDHSIMFAFASALVDGEWHHQRTFASARVRRPELVRLWQKVYTVADDEWTRRYVEAKPMEKDHGCRIVIRFRDGSTLIDELAVPHAHPRGTRPFDRDQYLRKFRVLTEDVVGDDARERFLAEAIRMPEMSGEEVSRISVETAEPVCLPDRARNGLL